MTVVDIQIEVLHVNQVEGEQRNLVPDVLEQHNACENHDLHRRNRCDCCLAAAATGAIHL